MKYNNEKNTIGCLLMDNQNDMIYFLLNDPLFMYAVNLLFSGKSAIVEAGGYILSPVVDFNYDF